MKAILVILSFGIGAFLVNDDLKKSMLRGKKLYSVYCLACHMADGDGMAGAFPPLAGSDYLMEDVDRSIRQVLYGYIGPMVVNGITYNGEMTPFEGLEDQEIADILNYVRNSWGNSSKIIKAKQVKAERE